MQYLADGSGPGDTAFNVWPVPVTTVSNMPKTSAQVHDNIFANDVAQDSGAEDGSGTAVVQDLGDNLSRFPGEFHEKFTREMIYVWEIGVGVILEPWLCQVHVGVHIGEQARSRHSEEQGPQGFQYGQLAT